MSSGYRPKIMTRAYPISALGSYLMREVQKVNVNQTSMRYDHARL